ncbi:MAG TPA: FAD-dependent oxidoreductase [Flavobacteriaceae bacterium]|jgi:glycine/D-amino acid oxidase-like deaminating enzyme|nr:FAD-dependent oxidoreductase [Flavobacteriaceae bacterium]HBS11526.1 FAD-dependent oxidoreductase [Flavobacteriaceae bacterium]
MNVDYIIVGLGLAGLAFTEELERNHKSYVVFEDNSQNSSLVAGGVYNPVILKRFTPVWDALDQLKSALPFYQSLEKKLNTQFDFPIDIYRVFTSIEEQNNWFNACDKPFFEKYMIAEVVKNHNEYINAPFGFGHITNTGKIDTKALLQSYRNYLVEKNKLFNESFDYDSLQLENNEVVYKNFNSKQIVFCEGYGVVKNPFFKSIPLKEAKGELLTIHAPELKLEVIIKSSVFIMPLGDSYYKIGATFNWTDKTLHPTKEAKEELIKKLNKVITVDYKVVGQSAGIRPTVKDRRPILGRHSTYKQLAILNGLGTRGVMLAPKLAKQLYDCLENNKELDAVININRFEG